MDLLSFLTQHPMDLSVFLEPRGFMRFLQLSFSVLAFAAIRGYEGFVDIKFCETMSAHLIFEYPFKLSDVKYDLPTPCKTSPGVKSIALEGDFGLEGELFVLSCWLSLLYCLAIIYVYVKLTPNYENDRKWPIADFLASLAISGLWILHFVIWTHGVSGIKEATEPSRVLEECDAKLHCTSVSTSPYFGLNVSIALGLINLILWTSNQWFLFKETSWFGSSQGIMFRSPGSAQHV